MIKSFKLFKPGCDGPVTSKFSVDFHLLLKLKILLMIRQLTLFLFLSFCFFLCFYIVCLNKTIYSRNIFMDLLKVFKIHCIHHTHDLFYFLSSKFLGVSFC